MPKRKDSSRKTRQDKARQRTIALVGVAHCSHESYRSSRSLFGESAGVVVESSMSPRKKTEPRGRGPKAVVLTQDVVVFVIVVVFVLVLVGVDKLGS